MRDLFMFITTFVGVLTVVSAGTMMDHIFGEALFKRVRPEVKAKLEAIFGEDNAHKSVKRITRLVQKVLTPEELKEVEIAYKDLLLPMLQSTLQKQFGPAARDIDIPIEFTDLDDSDEDNIDDDADVAELLAKAAQAVKPKDVDAIKDMLHEDSKRPTHSAKNKNNDKSEKSQDKPKTPKNVTKDEL